MAEEISEKKSPGFWFYTLDFERDMQILPLAAQGLWIRMMCWASDNEEHRGFLELPTGEPMTDLDIAHRVGKPIKEVRLALEAMRRLGTFSEDTRQCIFSRRMARDTHISEVRRLAASKRASIIERAKDGTFAGAKHRAKPEQNPTVSVVKSDSVSDSVSVVVKSDDKKKNEPDQILTTTDDRKFASARDELVALMETTTTRRPEVKVVRTICNALEIQGGTLPEYLTDIRPRIERLHNRPSEGFFISQAKQWGLVETAAEPELAQARNGTGRCAHCNGVGTLADGAYCSCKTGRDLQAIANRKKPPSNEAAKTVEEHKTHG